MLWADGRGSHAAGGARDIGVDAAKYGCRRVQGLKFSAFEVSCVLPPTLLQPSNPPPALQPFALQPSTCYCCCSCCLLLLLLPLLLPPLLPLSRWLSAGAAAAAAEGWRLGAGAVAGGLEVQSIKKFCATLTLGEEISGWPAPDFLF